jgi:hypothetical protein
MSSYIASLHQLLDEVVSTARAEGYGRGYKDAVDAFYSAVPPVCKPVFVGDEAVDLIDWSQITTTMTAKSARRPILAPETDASYNPAD